MSEELDLGCLTLEDEMETGPVYKPLKVCLATCVSAQLLMPRRDVEPTQLVVSMVTPIYDLCSGVSIHQSDVEMRVGGTAWQDKTLAGIDLELVLFHGHK